MSIDGATFVVQRGADQFSCLGSELDNKLQDDDMLVCQDGGTHKAAKRFDILNSEQKFTDPEVDGFEQYTLPTLAANEAILKVTVTNNAAWFISANTASNSGEFKLYKTEDPGDPFELVYTQPSVASNVTTDAIRFFTWVKGRYIIMGKVSSDRGDWFLGTWSGDPSDQIEIHSAKLDSTDRLGEIMYLLSGVDRWSVADDVLCGGYTSGLKEFYYFSNTESVFDIKNWTKIEAGETVDNGQQDTPESHYFSISTNLFFATGGNSAMWCVSGDDLIPGVDAEVPAYYSTTSYSKLVHIASGNGLSIAANDSSWTYIYWTTADPTQQHIWQKVEIGSGFRVKSLLFDPKLNLFFVCDGNGKVHTSSDGVNWPEVPNGTGGNLWSDLDVANSQKGQVVVSDLDAGDFYFTGYYFKSNGISDDNLFVVTDGDNGHKSVNGAQVKDLFIPPAGATPNPLTWTQWTPPMSSITQITWAGQFIVFGGSTDSKKCFRSTNGDTWTELQNDINSTFGTYKIQSKTDDSYGAGGMIFAQEKELYYKAANADSSKFTPTTLPDTIVAFAAGNGIKFAALINNKIYSSTDHSTYTQLANTGGVYTQNFWAVAAGNGRWAAVVYDQDTGPNKVITTDNVSKWEPSNWTAGKVEGRMNVVFVGNKFFITTDKTANGCFWHSDDGLNWIEVSVPPQGEYGQYIQNMKTAVWNGRSYYVLSYGQSGESAVNYVSHDDCQTWETEPVKSDRKFNPTEACADESGLIIGMTTSNSSDSLVDNMKGLPS